MATETHIIPYVDGETHDFAGCLCQPKLSRTDDGWIFTHRTFRKSGRYQIFEATDAPESPEDTREETP